MAETVLQRIDDVVQREVAGEAFLVPIRGHLADSQELYVLNGAGQWLWSQLEAPRSLEDLARSLVTEFEVDYEHAQRDAETFVDHLIEAGLVRSVQAARGI